MSSNKLDFEAKRQSLNNNQEENRETYRQIGSENVDGLQDLNMVRDKSGEPVADGADEKMLGSDEKETLALKNVEVKFIASDQNQNGDAKIEIGNGGEKATFTGMTKEELMKYANDPFWVKLRWFLFVLFWLAWIGMLVGAVCIIVFAPKCAAPTPLEWFKKGPLAKIDQAVDDSDIEKMKEFEVQGVIYELPGDETYKVESGEVHERIKGLVEKFKAKDIHVVIDLTPNYVTKEDQLFKDATKADAADEESLSAFVTRKSELKWKKVNGAGSAWAQVSGTYFLSQFEENYDINLNKPVVQERLKKAIKSLVDIGVQGFRFVNAKHYIVSDEELVEESKKSESSPSGLTLDDYGFYAHPQREFVKGLGEVIKYYRNYVENITNNEGFLTIRDDISSHVENFADKKVIYELPRFGFINSFLHTPETTTSNKLFNHFKSLSDSVDLSYVWTQIEYTANTYKNFEESAYKLFVSFLRGVQIAPLNDLIYIKEDKGEYYKKILSERTSRSAVFEHGNFDYYLSSNGHAFAYSRIKSGNPGLFVVINPTSESIVANFTSKFSGSDLSIIMASENFAKNLTKSKIHPDKIEMPKQSTAVYTFVPK